MKLIVILVVTFVSCQAVTDVNNNGRVTGGQNAKLGEFPWQVAIHYNEDYRCLGVLITEKIVLTLRDDNCVKDTEVTEGSIYLHLGSLVAAENTNRAKVATFLPDTTTTPVGALVGLETATKIVVGNTIRAIKLTFNEIAPDTPAQSSGWGFNNERIYLYLQYLDLNVTYVENTTPINAEISSPLQPNHACLWDRGTGLVITDESTLLPLLIGIAASNEGACEVIAADSIYLSTIANKVFIEELLNRPT